MSKLIISTATSTDNFLKWKEERKGFITSSDTPYNANGKLKSTWKTRAGSIAVEVFIRDLPLDHPIRMTHVAYEKLDSADRMGGGTYYEGVARKIFNQTYNVEIKEVGFAYIEDTIEGTSVDGILGQADKQCVVEFKAPSLANFLDPNYINKYTQQIQQHIRVMGVKSVLFVKYFPHMKMIIKRVYADEEYQKELNKSVEKMTKKVNEDVTVLKSLMM